MWYDLKENKTVVEGGSNLEKQEKYANLEKIKKSTHLGLIAKRKTILTIIVGAGQELNVGLAINLVM